VLKRPLRCILRVQGCHHPSYVMVWLEVPHQRVTHLHFYKKGVKLVSECLNRTCYKELWYRLTWPSSMVTNGSSSRTQFLPKSQDASGVAAEECSGLYQRRGLALGESRPQPPGLKIVGCFGGHGLSKASQQPGQCEEIPRESGGRDPPGDSACRDSRVAGASQGLHRGRGAAILSVIIINKNLKVLLINHLAQKEDVLSHFPSRSQYTWDRTYGRTVCILTFIEERRWHFLTFEEVRTSERCSKNLLFL
jgi:hypothetical protein